MTNTQPSSSKSIDRAPSTLELVSDTLAFGVLFAIALTIVQRGFGFLRGILFCRMMTEQELGQWSMVYSFLMLLAPLAVLGLPGCFGRFVEHYLQRGQLATFIRRIAVISCFLTFGLAACMFAVPDRFSMFFFRSNHFVGLINAMAFALVFVTANNFVSTLMESLRQVRLATFMRFITGITFAVVGTGLIAVWQNGSIAASIGFGLACALGLLPGVAFLFKHRMALADKGDELTHRVMWKRIAPFALWLWASNFVTNLFEVSDRYMLVHCSETSVVQAHGFVGQYHSGRVLPLLLVGVGVVIEGVLMPFAASLWEKSKEIEAKKMVGLAGKMMAIGFSAASVGILLVAPYVFNQIFEGRYDDGLAVLPITLLYCIWFSLINLLSIYLLVIEKGKWIFAVIGAGLVVNLTLNALLIPPFGLWGAVSATTISMLITLIAMIVSNHLCGLAIDRGLVLATAVPLVAMMSPLTAVAAMGTIIATALFTELFFNKDEKALAYDHASRLADKFLSKSTT